jgi:hypothetical protein
LTTGRIDTYIVNLRNPKVTGASGGSTTVSTLDGQFSLTGRIGVRSQGVGGAPDMDGCRERLSVSGGQVTPANQVYSGTITGFTRKVDGAANDAFIYQRKSPAGNRPSMAGSYR